jgi:hypothetical protein
MDVQFLDDAGVVQDYFTMMKDVNQTTTVDVPGGQSVTLTASWIGDYVWNPNGETTQNITFTPVVGTTRSVSSVNGCRMDNFIVNYTLPMELLSFEARKQGLSARLTWATASEKDNDFFTLERSTDNREFKEIARIAGANGTEREDYVYMDVSTPRGMVYYRFRQQDFDGQYTYSRVVALDMGNATDLASIRPNSVGNLLTVQVISTEVGEGVLEIYNPQGQLSLSRSFDAAIGSNVVTWDVSDLSPGIYQMVLRVGDGNRIARQFVLK